jgi:hypothetical protein
MLLCRLSSGFVGTHIFARETIVSVLGVQKGSICLFTYRYVGTLAKFVWRYNLSARSGCVKSAVITNWDVLSAAQPTELLFLVNIIIRAIIGVIKVQSGFLLG